MHDFAIALDDSLHAEKPCTEQLAPLSIDKIAPNNHVDAARFVLQSDENHAARRIGPLPASNQSRCTCGASMRQLRQLSGSEHTKASEAAA